MKAVRTRWLVGATFAGLGAVAGLELTACSPAASPSMSGTGATTGTGGAAAGTGGTTGSGGTGTPPGSGGMGGGVVYPPGGPAPTAVPIRRLTNSEYTQAVNDLFSKQPAQSDGTIYPGFTIPPPTFILDNKIFGFTNISSQQTGSQVLLEQYEGAAQMIAQGDGQTPQVWKGVTADPTALTGGCDAAVKTELVCAQPYLYNLARRAYRRPLTAAEKTALWNLFLNNAISASNPTGLAYQERLALAIEGVLMSPHFIFRPELGDPAKVVSPGIVQLTPWEMANRLSFFINGSMPDADLAAVADSGVLSNVAEVQKQAQHLLLLPRSQTTLVKMHEQWLGIESVNALTKNAAAFPNFTSTLAFEMGLETRTFIKNVMFTQNGTFNDLLLAPYTFGNTDIAKLYNVPAPSADPTVYAKINLDPTQRMGLLTQPSLLATLAKDSPVQDLGTAIRRGKFVLQQILCRTVTSPPQALVATFMPLDLTKVTREQAKTHETSPSCAGCHSSIDPLGLPFEKYDMVGQWRETDKGVAIDVSGQIADDVTNANPMKFNGIPELARLVTQRTETRACYLQQWFQFSSGKIVDLTVDRPYLDWLTQNFTPTQKLVDLVVNVVTSDSFRQHKVDPTAGSAP